MTSFMNVLVFPAGTEIAFEIHDALKYSKNIRLFGGTSVACHADFLFRNCIDGFPYADSPDLIPFLNRVIDEYGIDFIYPAHDSALKRLSDERDQIHACVIASPQRTVELCRSKNATYAALRGAPYLPAVWTSPEEIPFYPVFIKPSVGQSSEGTQRIDDRAHLEEALASGTEYAVCEYLPGDEFTVDCFTDRRGALRLVRPRSRERIRAGIAVRSRALPENAEIKAIAEDINRRLDFTGAWFFQLKKNTAGEYRLLEIAPRIAGTMGLTRSRGLNLPLLTLYTFAGTDVALLDNGNQVLLDRAFISRFRTDLTYDRVCVDFDDTLALNGKVNASLMMFLYQARNEGKTLILLSRHEGNIHEDLRRLCIPETLFDDIIVLDRRCSKADFIPEHSIFIDDSFAERKQVHDTLGIPVFDLDMIEGLIDWRL